jgi:oligopeptide/dipeptide ABC transporter ATP-binding protein
MRYDAHFQVKNLTVEFQLGKSYYPAVRQLSFDLKQGETFGLAGESGCGKSTVALAIIRLLPDNARIRDGAVWFQGRDLLSLSQAELRELWWKNIAMIFQASLNSLNPVKRVGEQIAEVLTVREGRENKRAWERVEELFVLIGIRPERARDYPHEFSGGMRQRVMIAMALCLNPSLIIADECTTALDVMIQAQIVNLMKDLTERFNLSMIFINHDLALIAEICDRVAVMYAGRIVELGPVSDIFIKPAHPYVQLLIKAMPSMEERIDQLVSIPGAPPSLKEISTGCSFLPRCPYGDEGCSLQAPPYVEITAGHCAACFKID